MSQKNKKITEVLKQSYINYSMDVITDRALPDIRDGLKPSQRRLLYTMYELNLNGKNFRKCAKICGDVSGNYHPHGEQVIYPTLVNLAQKWNTRYKLIDGQGNFGSIDNDPPAAMRYTQAKLSQISKLLFDDLGKNIITYVDNYDNTRKQPSIIPTKIPLILINGSFGLAVGMTTNIPPHNLKQVCQCMINLIKDQNYNIYKSIKAPDFPTGGIIYDKKSLKQYIETGQSKIVIRSKIQYEQKLNNKYLVIKQIPYNISKTQIIQSIVNAIKNQKVNNIIDIRDQSIQDQIRIVLILKKNTTDYIQIINNLYSNTLLESNYYPNLMCIENNMPKNLTIKEILLSFIKFRRQIVKNRLTEQLYKKVNRLNILAGYNKILSKIKQFIQIVTSQQNYKQILIQKFQLNESQFQAIMDTKISRFKKMQIEKIKSQIQQLVTRVKQIKLDLKNEKNIDQIIITQTQQIIEKYKDNRRSQIV